MVDVGDYTSTFIINQFKGLNERDNEDYLPLGDTPRGQNFEIVTSRSLTKKQGTTSLYSENAHSDYAWRAGAFHWAKREVPYYLGVSFPNIELITPKAGFSQRIYNGLVDGIGEGSFIAGEQGDSMWVDSGNCPVHISDTVATKVTWPPVYVNQNKEKVNASGTVADNPTTLGVDIGYPSLGAYFEDRYVLAGDPIAPRRLYFSKIREVDFQDNTDLGLVNIAFFLDVPGNSPIVGVKVMNDKYLIILCRNATHVITGKFPPSLVGPGPQIGIRTLNPGIGCVGRKAFTEKGNNDIFFISNKQSLYTLTATDNFRDVRPYGLSEKIYKAFRAIDLSVLQRAELINDNNKGELQIWVPKDKNSYYPNKRYTYNYGSSQDEAEWGEDNGFPHSLRSAFLDEAQNKVILVDRNKFLEDGEGLTYDGTNIWLKYQIAPIDFIKKGPNGDPAVRDQLKEVVYGELTYRIDGDEEAEVAVSHAWDDGKKSGLQQLTLKPVSLAKYGDRTTKFGSSKYFSNAGSPINTVPFKLLNNKGKVLKIFLQSSSPAKLTIVDLKLRYKLLGKCPV